MFSNDYDYKIQLLKAWKNLQGARNFCLKNFLSRFIALVVINNAIQILFEMSGDV